MIADTAQALGVRVPQDVQVSASGDVEPLGGGMSVAPSIRDLPPHRIPRRLRDSFPEAAGSDRAVVWRAGTERFADAPFTDDLKLRVDKTYHGLIEPSRPMPLAEFRAALAQTVEDWTRAPEDRS
jgi:hypothetical protein